MQAYQLKIGKLAGTDYAEVVAAARKEYHKIQKHNPRRHTYIRSKYFKKDKIFINSFWEHLNQKIAAERLRRLRLFKCGIELIRKSPNRPHTTANPKQPEELLYRFVGRTKDGELFYAQVRENKKTGRKYFMSVFPAK